MNKSNYEKLDWISFALTEAIFNDNPWYLEEAFKYVKELKEELCMHSYEDERG